MIDHLGMPVGDLVRATEFYLKALAPLGYGIVMEVSAAETGDGASVGFGPPGKGFRLPERKALVLDQRGRCG